MTKWGQSKSKEKINYIFWDLKKECCCISCGGCVFFYVAKLKKYVSFESLKLSASSSPEMLAIRGESIKIKWGHEQDVSPDPQAMCCIFYLSAQRQVCRRQLVCIRCSGTRKQEFKSRQMRNKQQLVTIFQKPLYLIGFRLLLSSWCG